MALPVTPELHAKEDVAVPGCPGAEGVAHPPETALTLPFRGGLNPLTDKLYLHLTIHHILLHLLTTVWGTPVRLPG